MRFTIAGLISVSTLEMFSRNSFGCFWGVLITNQINDTQEASCFGVFSIVSCHSANLSSMFPSPAEGTAPKRLPASSFFLCYFETFARFCARRIRVFRRCFSSILTFLRQFRRCCLRGLCFIRNKNQNAGYLPKFSYFATTCRRQSWIFLVGRTYGAHRWLEARKRRISRANTRRSSEITKNDIANRTTHYRPIHFQTLFAMLSHRRTPFN